MKHNQGGVSSTKHRRPLVMIYLEGFASKPEAQARERWSKTLEGGAALRHRLVELGMLRENNTLSSGSAG